MSDVSGSDLSGANQLVVADPFRGEKKNRRIGDVKVIIEEEYNDKDYIISTSLDILALYIKGQKILYTEAKVYCEQQLNMLMLPAIFISAVCTLLSVGLKDVIEGSYIVSGFAAINSFILAIISYLKLDAKAEAHKTSAYMYDKLGSVCEFNSGKVMFFKSEGAGGTRDNVMKLVSDVETKITEIKDTNKFLLPEVVRYRYKELMNQNLFSSVKQLQIDDLVLKTELKALLNRVDILRERVEKDNQEELDEAIEAKEQKIIEIIKLRKEYIKLNDDFKTLVDIQVANASRRCCWRCTRWLKT
jgi:hypothetical protein